MISPVTYENLRLFTYSNDDLIAGEIRGIVIYFDGMGCDGRFDSGNSHGDWFARRNIVYLHPYGNPWAWMNRQQVAFADELIGIILRHYGLPEDLPVAAIGRSMGGQGALTYMAYAERTPVACAADCPVCDMPFHYSEREDLPTSFYSAYNDEDGTMDEILYRHSPLHLLESGQMPRVPYMILHCMKDVTVSREIHSDRFVAALEKAGYPVTYRLVPDKGHCDLREEDHEALRRFCADAILGK